MVKLRNHYFIFGAVFLYFLSRFFINETLLPDYEAYKAIYNMRASNYESTGSDLFFVYFVRFFYYLNFSYESFRFLLVLISLFLIVFSSLIFVKYKKWMFIQEKTKLSDFFICIVLFFSTYMFLFEFFSIRLRGGLSLSFFYAFSVFFIVRKKSLLFYFFSILFLYMSFGTHLSTAITLFGFLTVPTILFLNLKFFSRVIGVRLYFSLAFWLSVLSGFSIVFGMIYFSSFRGEHLNSKLNFVRFLFMSVVPLLIYFFVDMKKINNSIQLYNCLLLEKNNNRKSLSGYSKEIWIYFVTNAYVGCAIALISFYSIGMLSTAGEAAIRVFTLSSVSSLLVLSLQKNKINFFWFFVIFSNSMFFFNTVFL